MKKKLVFKFLMPIAVFMVFAMIIVQVFMISVVKYYSKNTASSQIEHTIESVLQVLTTTDDLMMIQVKRSMEHLRGMLATLGQPVSGGVVEVAGKKVPDVVFGSTGQANNFAVVDSVAQTMGGSATVFTKSGSEYVRISTNVKKDDGSRAIGTILAPDGKAVKEINAGKPYYGELDILGAPYITGYEPIFDKNKNIIGISFVGYKVTTLKGLETVISEYKILSNGFLAVIDGKGKVRFSSRHVTPEKIEKLMGAKDTEWVSVEKAFPAWDFKIVAAYPISDLSEIVNKLLIYVSIGVIVLFLVFIVFILWTVKKTVLTPLNSMVAVSEEISRGNLTVKIETARQDEVGRLLVSMKLMAERLAGVLQRMLDSSKNIMVVSGQLNEASVQVARGVSEQSERSTQIAASSEEMSQTVVHIAENALHIEATAKETSETARAGEDIVLKAVNEVNAIAGVVNESASLMSSLGQRSKQIGDIVGVIKDIADQTNLLALNAAIEAARAGEQGRGFAVVADEVRKLAERTGSATSEISTMITAIQQEVQVAVNSMDLGTRRVEVGVQYAREAGNALHDIVAGVESFKEMVHQIATATSEMSEVSNQITSNIETIADVSRNTSSVTATIDRLAAQLKDFSGSLESILREFNLDDSKRSDYRDNSQRRLDR
ncbi:MAG: methyl-accepting chemotaxis protein [Nitrospirae bacterium YQR-1]